MTYDVLIYDIRRNELDSLDFDLPSSIVSLYLCYNRLKHIDLRYLKNLRYVCLCHNLLETKPLVNPGVKVCTDFNPCQRFANSRGIKRKCTDTDYDVDALSMSFKRLGGNKVHPPIC
jgi:hypothetical protein